MSKDSTLATSASSLVAKDSKADFPPTNVDGLMYHDYFSMTNVSNLVVGYASTAISANGSMVGDIAQVTNVSNPVARDAASQLVLEIR